MTTDVDRALHQSNPIGEVPAYSAADRIALLDRTVAQAPHRARRNRGRRMATVTAMGATVLVAGGAVAWAVWRQPAEAALQVGCAVGMDRAQFDQLGTPTSILGHSMGDPLADCAAEYERIEGTVPPLTAYETGDSYVAVVPTEWTVPQHWRALPGSFRTDPRRLELEQRLGDIVDGPTSACRTADQAEVLVRADLKDLGLETWTVGRLSQASRAGRDDWCAVAWVDETRPNAVVLQGTEGAVFADDAQFRSLVRDLRADISQGCVPLPEASRLAREAVRSLGSAANGAKISTIADSAARCSRVDVIVGGRVSVTVRGPAG